MIFIRAQALDNLSEDPCVVNGRIVHASDPTAAPAMRALADTMRHGRTATSGSTQITESKTAVAIKIRTDKRDVAGRPASVVALLGRERLDDIDATVCAIADYTSLLDRAIDVATISADLRHWRGRGKFAAIYRRSKRLLAEWYGMRNHLSKGDSGSAQSRREPAKRRQRREGKIMGRLSDRTREQRRVVLILTAEQARAALRDPSLVDFFDDDETAVVTIQETAGTDDPLITQLSSQNRIRAGGLLIQSPYNPSQYEFADSAVPEFAVAKFMLISRVCQFLGATSVKVDNVIAKGRDKEIRSKSRTTAGGGSGSADAEYTLRNKVRERLEVTDTFPGGSANVEEARRLLAEVGLTGDATLEAIINMRAYDNTLTKREIKISLTQESDSNLRIAAKYAHLAMVSVSASFERQVKENVNVVLQATITFPKPDTSV